MMPRRNLFSQLDGRHKAAIVAAVVAWTLSIIFSNKGFSIAAPDWWLVGWALSGIITIVELVFNSRTNKLSKTLIIAGILCYVFGIKTNVEGFYFLQNPNISIFSWKDASLLLGNGFLAILVGTLMEIIPEPLFMWGLGKEFEGDPIGNMMGLFNGELSYAKNEQKMEYVNIPASIPRSNANNKNPIKPSNAHYVDSYTNKPSPISYPAAKQYSFNKEDEEDK